MLTHFRAFSDHLSRNTPAVSGGIAIKTDQFLESKESKESKESTESKESKESKELKESDESKEESRWIGGGQGLRAPNEFN